MATIPTVVADFETSLDQSVSEGDTTAALLSNVDTDGVTIANGYYGFTVDPDTDYKEFIVCTVTGTALTDIYNVSDQGTATAGSANYHRRGATVQITDHTALLKVVQTLRGDIGIDSASPLYYESMPALGSGLQLATVQYVLDVVNGGAVTFNAETISGIAGEVWVGATAPWVYLNTADGRWYQTTATQAASSLSVRIGKARTTSGSTSVGAAIPGGVFVQGLETVGTYTPFATYYLSDSSGVVSTSPGTNSVVVGIADANGDLVVGLVPASTADAAVGTVGTPSASNKFITQAGTSVDGVDQSQLTQNGTTPIGQSNLASGHNIVAQSFTPTKSIIRGVNLYKSANTGTFTGDVVVGIFADSGNAPSGAALATKTIPNATYNAYPTGAFLVLFTAEATLTPGTRYWIRIAPSTADTANCINLGTNTSGGYSGGLVKWFNTTTGIYTTISTIDLYFSTLEGANGKGVLADSTGFVPVGIRKTGIKIGNLTLANSATSNLISHGLGKVPTYIEIFWGGGGNSAGIYGSGVYDPATATYASNGFYYNEATSGGSFAGTTYIIQTLNDTAGSPVNITVLAMDENIVLLSADSNLRTVTYKIVG